MSRLLIAALFIVSGIMHFVKPSTFTRIMPPWLPAHMQLVLLSGALEIAGGIGILIPALRVAAGWGLIVLLVVMFPANVQMLLNAHREHWSTAWQAALVIRLPLQALLIYWIYRATM